MVSIAKETLSDNKVSILSNISLPAWIATDSGQKGDSPLAIPYLFQKRRPLKLRMSCILFIEAFAEGGVGFSHTVFVDFDYFAVVGH